MPARAQSQSSKRTTLIIIGVVFLTGLGAAALVTRWMVGSVKLMRSPAASTARQFVESLAAGDRQSALALCDPSALTEATLLDFERQSAKMLEVRSWSVTFAREFSDDGTDAIEVFLVPKLRDFAESDRAFIVDVVSLDDWKVRRIKEVDRDAYKMKF
jgi:hypothetical protein